MKVLANETKRILAVLLSVAMIFAYVPQNVAAYADEVSDNDTEEAAVEGSGEESISDALNYSAEGEENTSDEGEVSDEKLDSDADVEVQLNLAAVPASTLTHFADAASGDTATIMAPTCESDDTTDDSTVFTRLYKNADSEAAQGYSFYVKADTGYTFEDNWISVTYSDFSKVTYANRGNVADVTPALVLGTDYTYTQINESLRLVTLPKKLLGDVVTASYYSDAADQTGANKYAKAQIRVTVANTDEKIYRLIDKPTVTSDITVAPNWADGNRKVNYITTTAAADAAEIKGLDAYVKNKTVTYDMITVTYTPADGSDATEYAAITGTSTTIDNNDTSKYVVYDATANSNAGALYIARNLSNLFVTDAGKLTISIDGTVADEKEKTVTVVSNKYINVYKNGTTTALSGTKFEIAGNLVFDVNVAEAAGSGRTVKKIVVTENNDGTVIDSSTTAGATVLTGAGTDPTYVWTLAGSTVDDDITISVVTQETVDTTEVGANGTVLDEDGAALTAVESGRPLTFEVRPKSGYVVKTVTWHTVGGDDNSLSLTGDNVYTINTNIEEKIFIGATFEAAKTANAINVVLKGGADDTSASAATAASVYTGTGTTSADEFVTGETWTKTKAAVIGKYYYFSVKPTTGYTISAKYRFGTTGDYTGATLVSEETNYNVYRTPVVPTTATQIDLNVVAVQATKLLIPDNARVEVSFENNDLVDPSEDFEFTINTVETTDSTITIDKVVWNNDSSHVASGTEIKPDSNGKYRLAGNTSVLGASDSKTNGIKIVVTTTETVNSGYKAVFALASDSADYPKLVTNDDSSQKLNLIYGETTKGNLTAVFWTDTRVKKYVTGVLGTSTVATDAAKYEEAGISTATEDEEDADKIITSVATTTAIKANNIGDDTIAAVLTNTSNGNTKVWKATLPVSVTSAYTDLEMVITRPAGGVAIADSPAATAIMEDEAGTDNTYSNKVAQFSIFGKNVQTGETEQVKNGSNGITIGWAFDPTNKDDSTVNYRMATAYNTTFNGGDNTEKTGNTVFVRANKAQAKPITIKAKITYDGVDDPEYKTGELNITDEETYLDFGTLTPENAAESSGSSVSTTLAMGLSSGDVTTADLQYDIYKQNVATLTTTDIDTKAKLDKSMALGEVDPVTDNIEWTAEVTNTPATDTTEYVEVKNNGKGSFTFNAKKKTSANVSVKITAKVDDVEVKSKTFTVTVASKSARGTIQLKINDSANTEVVDGAKVTKQLFLSDTFINNRENSIVKTNNNTKVADRNDWGYKFTNELVGGTFVLPGKSSFDTNKASLMDNRILVGWYKGSTVNTYYYPGEAVTVADGDVYTAVWMDEYAFPTADLASQTGYTDKGVVLYNKAFPTVVDEEVTSYGKYSEMNGAAVTTQGTKAGKISGGASVDLVMTLVKRAPLEEQQTGVTDLAAFKADDNTKVAASEFVTGKDLTLDIAGSGKDVVSKGTGDASSEITALEGATADEITVKAAATKNGITFETVPVKVTIQEDPGYIVEVNGDETKTAYADQISGMTVSVTTFTDGDEENVGTLGTSDWDTLGYNFVWSSDNESVATVEGGSTGATRHTASITALSKGSTVLTVTITDASGAVGIGTCNLTVEENPITVTITDDDGEAPSVNADGLYVIPAQVGKNQATDYKVATNKTVTWTTGGYDNVVVKAVGIDDDNYIKINSSGVTAAGVTGGNELSDKGTATLKYKYTIGGTEYTFAKELAVSTYYKIGLDVTTGGVTTQFVTVGGSKVTTSTGEHNDTELRVTTKNQKVTVDPSDPDNRSADTYTYEGISLETFGGIDTSTTAPKEFIGWKKNATGTPVDYTTTIDKLTSGSSDGSSTLVSGSYKLAAVFQDQAIEKVTIAQTTITLTNEPDATKETGTINKKTISMKVEPYLTGSTLDVVPDKSTLYKGLAAGTSAGKISYTPGSGTPADLTAVSGAYTLPYGSNVNNSTGFTGAVYVSTTDKTRTDNFGFASVTDTNPANRRAGEFVFDIQDNDESLATVTVYVNGYDGTDGVYYENGDVIYNDGRYVNGDTWYFDDKGARITGNKIITKADGTRIAIVDGVLATANSKVAIDGKTYYVGESGVVLTGWITKTGVVTTDTSQGVYYADPENDGAIVVKAIKAISGVTYYFDGNGERAVASSSANLYENVSGTDYYVNAAGEVAINGIFKVDGVDRLFTEEGKIITYADTVAKGTPGKYTVGGVIYKIDETTNRAEADHTEHKWAFTSMDWTAYNFSTQSGTVTAKFTCEVGKEEGTAPATVKVENKAVKGTETELGYSVFKFTATADKDPSGATVSNPATETVYKQFRGGAWMDATEADWKAAGGESGESKTPGETESEPAKSEVASYQSYNLFFSSQRTIAVPGLQDAISAGGTFVGGKKGYYSVVEGEDAVTITSTDKKDIKAAATAANSLITAGAFTYQLPVYYQKPTLKLTSTKGIRKKGDSAVYTFKTSVLEKKSSGNFEPIALEEGDITANSKLAGVLALTEGGSAITTDETTVSIATIKKGSGKLVVQAKDGDKFAWAEPVELSYSVTENAKDVIDLSAKTVNMNVQATKIDGTLDTQTVTIKVNGQNIEDLPEGTTVTADLSKITGKGVNIEGIDADGKVSASELKFGYDSTITKGTYKIKLTAGTGKAVISVKVADKDINKAVTLTVKSKMDVTKHQKMVIIPKLNTVGGEIAEEVGISEKYDAQYYPESNKIVVGPKGDDWTTVSKGNFEEDITVTVAGIPCKYKVKTKILAAKPTVKIAAVTFANSAFPGTAESPLAGETNILATYKMNGKTFSMEPATDTDGNALVKFPNGTPSNDVEGGYLDSKTNTIVKYEAETGKIIVLTTAQSKKGTVKVEITYPGQTAPMKKSFKIATK